MCREIIKNLVYLTKNLVDLENVILYFEQEEVCSSEEGEHILSGTTLLDKNKKFWNVLQTKNWGKNEKLYLKILRQTNNGDCADKIEGTLTDEPQPKRMRLDNTNSCLSTSTTNEDNDFKVSELGAVEIVKVIENYPDMKPEWKKVVIKLGLSGKSQGKLPDGEFGNLVLETINLWRNEKGSNATFNTFVKAIKTTINLNEVVEKLLDTKHHIREVKSTDETQDENKRRLVLKTKWWPYEKFLPKSFQERHEQGLKLVEHLQKQILRSKIRCAVICQGAAVFGPGEVGKTTTAIWFARHYQNLYDHIIWIDCGKDRLKTFKNLAMELKIHTQSLLQLLAKDCFSQFEGLKCLCIFDNAESYEGIKDILPKSEIMHCIITSRAREWGKASGDGNILETQLTTFDLENSIQFLRNNLQCDDSQLLKELSILLGNLPLALNIAITAINKNNMSVQNYIQKLKETSHIIHQNFDDYYELLQSIE